MKSAGEPFSGRRILVVEDEPLIALDIQETLERGGAIVIGPTARVVDALTLVEQSRPEAAVLDVCLEDDATTFPVAAWLAEQRIPFIFQTSDPGAIEPAYRNVPMVRKPFQPEQLIAAVIEILALK